MALVQSKPTAPVSSFFNPRPRRAGTTRDYTTIQRVEVNLSNPTRTSTTAASTSTSNNTSANASPSSSSSSTSMSDLPKGDIIICAVPEGHKDFPERICLIFPNLISLYIRWRQRKRQSLLRSGRSIKPSTRRRRETAVAMPTSIWSVKPYLGSSTLRCRVAQKSFRSIDIPVYTVL